MKRTATAGGTLASPGRIGRRVGSITGLALGAALGSALVLFAGGALAERAADASSHAVLDATHLPPLLTVPGEPLELRYDAHCVPLDELPADAPCDVIGSAYVRPGAAGPYREVPLRVDSAAAEGRFVARVPADAARSARGFSYYAVFRSPTTGATTTLPAGGARAPQTSVPLGAASEVVLGRHRFGVHRAPDARVASAPWGDGPAAAGLESGRGVAAAGASSFDVGHDGAVHVLDHVHRRVLRWSTDATDPVAVPLAIDGTMSDLALAPDGGLYVLELAHGARPPIVHAFGPAGDGRGTAEIAERTASQIRVGKGVPTVYQQPSGQWVPTAVGRTLDVAAAGGPRAGRLLPGGEEVVVLRRGNELRAALVDASGARRSWRVTSETPMGEVQLSEPLGSGLLVVLRLYTDGSDEFVALHLGPTGLMGRFAVPSADWAETAPLSRFRLRGGSLYQLGSTSSGVFVDRYDLEAR
jgi:hypothetical protein